MLPTKTIRLGELPVELQADFEAQSDETLKEQGSNKKFQELDNQIAPLRKISFTEVLELKSRKFTNQLKTIKEINCYAINLTVMKQKKIFLVKSRTA